MLGGSQNSTSEDSLIFKSITGNSWQPGEFIAMGFNAKHRNFSGSTVTVTIKFYYGSDTITLLNASSVTSSPTIGYSVRGLVAYRDGSDLLLFTSSDSIPATSTSLTTAAISTDSFSTVRIVNPDFTVTKDIGITWQWSLADMETYIEIRDAYMYKM